VTSSWSADVLAAKAAIDARRAAARGRTVGDALADPIAVVRIRQNGRAEGPVEGRYTVLAYSDRHQRIPLDQPGQALYLTGLMQHWPSADWGRYAGWDYRLADDRLVPAPEIYEPGGIPQDDLTFGAAHCIPTTIGAA
jgi:hypothetical protein